MSVIAAMAGAVMLMSACLDDGGGGGEAGGRVEIVGGPGGGSAVALSRDVARLAEATGINVTYTTLPDFDTVIQSRVAGNNPPDLALFPQPGVLREIASRGHITPLDDLIDIETIGAAMVPGVAETGLADDGTTTLGLPVSINVKSLVWYPKQAFEDAGYEVPTTHQELAALTEQIKADGQFPWCFGIESGPGTGWPATDWIEEYVLRVGGPEVYDQWVTNEIPFNDPVVVQAGEAVEELLLSEGSVNGGRQAIVATSFSDSSLPLVADPPGCFLHRQANFITGFWPEEIQSDLATHIGTFLLPPYEGGWDGGQPILGGGDLVAAFTDNEDVRTVLEAMLSPEFGTEWAQSGEFLSPFPAFDTTAYVDATTGEIAGYIAAADAFRFDGSDLMPGQVGNGTFWSEMVAWMTGSTDLETALTTIEASWP